MPINSNAIKRGKAEASKKATATKKTPAPAPASAPAPTTPKVKIQSEDTQKASTVVSAVQVDPENLGARANDLEILQFGFTRHRLDNAYDTAEKVNAILAANKNAFTEEPKSGTVNPEKVNYKRPMAVAVEVKNISEEPITFFTSKIRAEEVSGHPNSWGMTDLRNPEVRQEVVLKPGESRWFLLSELMVRLLQTDFNCKISGGGVLTYSVRIGSRGKKGSLNASTNKTESLALGKVGDDTPSVLDAPGIILIDEIETQGKKQVTFTSEAPAQVQELLKDFIEYQNRSKTRVTRTASRASTAKAKRVSKADELLTMLNMDILQ